MKIYIILLVIICSNSIQAQQSLDTIYANDQKNVALFFPKPIRQGITGADHFVFTYNREKEQYFGLLQAKPGASSNLLTVTNDGSLYAYILQYAEKLPQLNYFLKEKEKIGNEKPEKKQIKEEKRLVEIKGYRLAYFQRACTYLLHSKKEVIAKNQKGGVGLYLTKMVYDKSEVYLVIEIRNNSAINFDIDYLHIYQTNGIEERKASYQRLEKNVLYKHKMPKAVLNGLSKYVVYVLPKFVLGDKEKIMLELKELHGSRRVVLETK